MQALNVIDSIQNSDLDNYKVFTDAYEYLTNKEKWDDLKLGEEYELNTSTPNIQTETSVLFEGDNLNESTFN
jgi:N-acetylneuraminic acid mutarotase